MMQHAKTRAQHNYDDFKYIFLLHVEDKKQYKVLRSKHLTPQKKINLDVL